MGKIFAAAILLWAATFFSCQDNSAQKLVLENFEYVKNVGPGCDTPDAEGANCVTLKLSWPTVKEGPAALQKSVDKWANDFVFGLISPVDEDTGQAKAGTVEEAAAQFIRMHDERIKESPDPVMAYYTAECQGRVLHDYGQYLTLEIEGYTFTGGAHGMSTAAVATFQVTTGKKLTIHDLVKDSVALKVLAEKAFRAKRADIFNPTDGTDPFQFDETFPFALPQNYGLMPEGIYCYYVPYEVGPYAIGSTQFVVPYSDLNNILKVERPAK